MKLRISIGFAVVALCCTVAGGQDQPRPLVQVRFQNLDAVIAGAGRIASAMGANPNLGDPLSSLIGSPNLAGIDRQRPWGVAVSSGDRQFAILYIPVTDFAAFRNSLLPSSPLVRASGAANPVFQVGEFAVAFDRRLPTDPQDLSPDEKQMAVAWAPPTAASGPPLVQIAVQIDETTRQQLLRSLSAGRTVIAQGPGPQPLPPPPGAIPPVPAPAGSQIMGPYFDLLETLAKALDRIEIQGEVSGQAIRISSRVHALPGSDLAKSFINTSPGIADIAGQLDPKPAISIAVAMGASPVGNQLLKRLLETNLQMQGAGLDEKAMSQYSRLVDSLAPLRFAASMDIGKGLASLGMYEFPGQDARQVYAAMMETTANVLPAMTGTHKPYSSVEFREGFRTVGDVPVSRVTTGLNLDQPALQAPGAKEILSLMFGGDKMAVEYAVKDGRLYVGSPDKMTEALGKISQTPPPQAATPPEVTAPAR